MSLVVRLCHIAITYAAALICTSVCIGAEIRGIIQDEARSPLPGASVIVRPRNDPEKVFRDTAAKDGSFLITGLALGVYSVEAERPGFVASKEEVDVRGPVVRVDLRLRIADAGEGEVEAGAHIVGILHDGNKALPGAVVCLENALEKHCVTTTRSGGYDLTLRTGVFTVQVRLGDLLLWSQRIDASHPGEYKDIIRR